jgi:hypothetical protein
LKNLIIALLSLFLTTGLFIVGCGDDSDTDDNDADGGGDTDTDTDTDTDADSGTGTECTGAGVWYDSTNALCWQDPPSETSMYWYVAAGVHDELFNAETEDYCGDLVGSGWRLPTISELRSLVRKGDAAECYTIEWDMAWTSVQTGYCGVWDSCLNSSSCWEDSTCSPVGCISVGPGTGGCLWDAALSGSCEAGAFWTVSELTDPTIAWTVYFDLNVVGNADKIDSRYTRCVRTGP